MAMHSLRVGCVAQQQGEDTRESVECPVHACNCSVSQSVRSHSRCDWIMHGVRPRRLTIQGPELRDAWSQLACAADVGSART